MKGTPSIILLFLATMIISCNDSKKGQEEESIEDKLQERPVDPANSSYVVQMEGIDSIDFKRYYNKRIPPPSIDLNQSVDNKIVGELELLKNTFFAMKGKIFSEAIVHNYFDTIPWYQPPFWDSLYTISLNEDERWFIDRIDARISQLAELNITETGLLNVDNTINAFQWPELMVSDQLKNQGFLMTSSHQNQLFDIYETNQNEQIPSFISTDLIMHQMHMFYGMLENEIEEKYLTEKLKTMLEIINVELYASYEKTIDPKIEQAIEESLLYYSIPYAVITGKKTNLIGRYNELYVDELTKVLLGDGKGSKIMNNEQFDYGIFKPYAQYAKNNAIKKYYKALTWLQKVNLCLNEENDFNKALIVAFIIHKNEKLKREYHDYAELKTYFSSQKDQFTLWDLANEIGKIESIRLFEDLFEDEAMAKIKIRIGIEEDQNCTKTVSLMPMEYQNLFTDLNEITAIKNGFPSSIDLFTALNNPYATKIFSEGDLHENKQQYLTAITENLVTISSQENARSMDWLSTLLTSFNSGPYRETVLANPSWEMKDLNTALASWVQLNQRVNLRYNSVKSEKQPEGDKVMVGYVEPRISFWNNALILLSNTQEFLSDRNMFSSTTAKNLKNLKVIIQFLLEISKKELNGIPISDEEFQQLNTIPARCHTLALQLINPKLNVEKFHLSNDMTFASNIYRNGKDKNTIAGISSPNYLMVLAEINGKIYITRGAVYSYFELPNYSRKSITTKTWKKHISEGLQAPGWAAELYGEKTLHFEPVIASN